MHILQIASSKSRFGRFFRHPVTLALIPIVLGAGGWAINRYIIEWDRSALRFEAQGVVQAVPLVQKAQLAIGGKPVFCDTAKLTLLLAHSQQGKRPILVNAIALHVESIGPEARPPSLNCEVDPLETNPFGIGLRHTYIFDAAGSALTGRFIESGQAGAARMVNPSNILQVGGNNQSVSLKPDEEPIAWDVFVSLKTAGLYHVWFAAEYDAGGFKITETQRFVLAK
jgi:hypothetical protein